MVDKESIKQLITLYVKKAGGCKVTDLITELPTTVKDHEVLIALSDYDVKILSQELVKEGRVLKVDYALPSNNTEETAEDIKNRARSFLLPPGSMVWEPKDN